MRNEKAETGLLGQIARARIVDLTHALHPDVPYWPGRGYQPFRYQRINELSADGVSAGAFAMPEHMGTHLDAPSHFVATGSAIDALEARQLVCPGITLDIGERVALDPGALLEPADLTRWHAEHGPFPAGCVVLARSGWSARWADPAAFGNAGAGRFGQFPAVSALAAEVLADDPGVAGVGVDTLSIDNGSAVNSPAHRLLHGAGKFVLESLANLECLPPTGFVVFMGVLPLVNGTGAPARVLALLPGAALIPSAALGLERFASWGIVVDRLIADGLAYPDIARAAATLESIDGWYAFWAATGDTYEQDALAALAQGHRLLAGELFWQACMAYHYGQFLWLHDLPTREAGQHRKAALYARAAPLLDPPAEAFAVRIDDVSVDAYLRLPPGWQSGPVPCVVLIGGLESTKEESYRFENECLLRGLATCVFDGPGQGETFFAARLRADFDRFTSAIVDALVNRAELDPRRIGILGRSLGGNYALRSAATDHRLVCCAAWSTRAHMDYWTDLPIATRQLYAYTSGYRLDELAAARHHVQAALDIRPILSGVRCPVYIQHGAQDGSIRQSDAETLAAGLTGAASVVLEVIPQGNHCSHNCHQRARPALVDWLRTQLVVPALTVP